MGLLKQLLLVVPHAFQSSFGKPASEAYPVPLTKHQLWTVSLSALFSERMPNASHTTLYPYQRISKIFSKHALSETWDVKSTEGLLKTLDWLRSGEQSAEIAKVLGHQPWAWDVARYVITVRDGLAAGYIDEPKAWELLAAAPPVAGLYDSWRAYAKDFMDGRTVWLKSVSQDEFVPQDDSQAAIDHLLDPQNTASPWQRLPWNAIHEPDGPLEPAPADAVTIQSKV